MVSARFLCRPGPRGHRLPHSAALLSAQVWCHSFIKNVPRPFLALLRARVAEVTAVFLGRSYSCSSWRAVFSLSGFLVPGGELRWTDAIVSYFKCIMVFFSSKLGQDGRLQVHPGAMEEEAVRCNALSSQGALLAVPPALCAPQGPPPNPAR